MRLYVPPAYSAVPIVVLSAREDERGKVAALELGADDYITKPFIPRELVLRVKNVLKRSKARNAESDFLVVGDITLDKTRLLVTHCGNPVDLTATELKLLRVLMERRGFVQSRATLLNDVWGYDSIIDTRTVDTHIRRLREKLEKAADCLETVRGFGYRISE